MILYKPSAESRPLIEPLQREIRLNENLLRDVLDVFPAPQDPAGDGEDAVLVTPDKLFKSRLVFQLRAPDKFPVVRSTRRLGGWRLGARRTGGGPQGLYFWDAWHVNPVTSNVAWVAPGRIKCFTRGVPSFYLRVPYLHGIMPP